MAHHLTTPPLREGETMYGVLPNTGLNISTPIYLLVGLIMLIVGIVTNLIARIKR